MEMPSAKLILIVFMFNILIGTFSHALGMAVFEAPEMPEGPVEGVEESIKDSILQWTVFVFSMILFMITFIFPVITGLPVVLWTILILPLYIATAYILLMILLQLMFVTAELLDAIIPF